jgi:hypothetical protein
MIPIRRWLGRRESELIRAKCAAEPCSAWTGEGDRPYTSFGLVSTVGGWQLLSCLLSVARYSTNIQIQVIWL